MLDQNQGCGVRGGLWLVDHHAAFGIPRQHDGPNRDAILIRTSRDGLPLGQDQTAGRHIQNQLRHRRLGQRQQKLIMLANRSAVQFPATLDLARWPVEQNFHATGRGCPPDRRLVSPFQIANGKSQRFDRTRSGETARVLERPSQPACDQPTSGISRRVAGLDQPRRRGRVASGLGQRFQRLVVLQRHGHAIRQQVQSDLVERQAEFFNEVGGGSLGGDQSGEPAESAEQG